MTVATLTQADVAVLRGIIEEQSATIRRLTAQVGIQAAMTEGALDRLLSAQARVRDLEQTIERLTTDRPE